MPCLALAALPGDHMHVHVHNALDELYRVNDFSPSANPYALAAGAKGKVTGAKRKAAPAAKSGKGKAKK